ncbi:MAG: tetratricopeptide repeat protein [bacterium]
MGDKILKITFTLTVFGLLIFGHLGNDLFGQITPAQDLKKIRNLMQAIGENEALLAKYPASDFTPNLMYQLVELYVQRAKLKFQREMLIFEEAERKYENDQSLPQPVMPALNYSAAVDMAVKLLDAYPNVGFRDKVLYRIALCQAEEGKMAQSVDFFKRLSEETENKQFLEEAYFRIAEYYFKIKDYPNAVNYYEHLLNSWDSPFFDMALYKLGWSYYSVSDYSQAISTFLYLIEDVNLVQQVEANYLGKTKADLREESKEYIAICFTEFGGPGKAREFLDERKEQAYTEEILLNLADLYQKRNYYAEAIETMQVLLDFYPNKLTTPSYRQAIVENYELANDKVNSTATRLQYIVDFGPQSAWLKQFAKDSTAAQVLATAESYQYALGSEAQATAQDSNSVEHYVVAVERYKEFVEKFKDSAKTSKVLFYLAECLYEIEKYEEAADYYFQLMVNYPQSEFHENAAYNRLLAYHVLLQGSARTDTTTLALRNFLGKNESRIDTVTAVNPLQAQFLQASNDFIVLVKQSERLPEVLMKYAECLYELSHYALAQEIYERVISDININSYIPLAYTMIGQCEFKQQHYVVAESWFQRITEVFPDSLKYLNRANKMIVSSKFKIAETYLEAGDSTAAAKEFEKIAEIAQEPTIAEKALFEGALLYEQLGKTKNALVLYEAIPEKNPETEHLDKALYKAAVLNEDLEDWQRSAINYLTLFEMAPNSPLAEKSLFAAARCFDNFGDAERARSTYQKYVEHFRTDADRYLEAAFRKGEIAYEQKNFKEAIKDFTFVVKAHQKFVEAKKQVENFIPANAQFLIAEILLGDFQKIRLTPPLERNLKKKKSRFQKVIKAYTSAAKYKIAEWTTASSYKIGLTFEDFADALLNSPRPENLSGDALMKYNTKLWESVLPLKEKALSTYQANIKQALENHIENNWISESKKRAKELMIELGRESVEVGLDTSM